MLVLDMNLGRLRNGNGFDQNGIGQLLADAQPRVADLANVRRIGGEQFDLLLLAETKFAQPVAHFRRGGQLFNAHHRPGFDPAEGTNFGPCAMALQNDIWLHRIFQCDAKLSELRLSCNKQFWEDEWMPKVCWV